MSAAGRRLTALVLAGSRGADDPLAVQAGVAGKALAPVGGIPMLLRVIRTLRQAPSVGRVAVCLDAALLAGADPALADEIAADVPAVPPGATPGDSVQQALGRLEGAPPLLVTTADHPLLTPAMVEYFLTAAPPDADVAVALASAGTIRAAYPDAARTFYRFGGQRYSGCNLFLLQTAAAAKAAAFWAAMDRHRKRPWCLAAAIGPLTLGRFLLGALTLEAALARLSTIAGARLAAVDMPFAEAAIDVDKPADLALAERILAARRERPAAGSRPESGLGTRRTALL
ncbi:MAG TPA: nucleotidyltransferase family protein [Methylomirabilota bacterium]|nr:nucleotidyltransferase family protein [Methylomirabilota bacterium]